MNNMKSRVRVFFFFPPAAIYIRRYAKLIQPPPPLHMHFLLVLNQIVSKEEKLKFI